MGNINIFILGSSDDGNTGKTWFDPVGFENLVSSSQFWRYQRSVPFKVVLRKCVRNFFFLVFLVLFAKHQRHSQVHFGNNPSQK